MWVYSKRHSLVLRKDNISLALMSSTVHNYNSSNGRIKNTIRMGNKDHARPIRDFQLCKFLNANFFNSL